METKAELEQRRNTLNKVIESYQRDRFDVEEKLIVYNDLAEFIELWKEVFKMFKKHCTTPFCGDCCMLVKEKGCLLELCDNKSATVESLFLGGNADD